jgi:hypothetical protein
MSAQRRPGRYARTFAVPARRRTDVGSQFIEISAGPGLASYGRIYPGGEIILGIASTAAAHLFAKPVAR